MFISCEIRSTFPDIAARILIALFYFRQISQRTVLQLLTTADTLNSEQQQSRLERSSAARYPTFRRGLREKKIPKEKPTNSVVHPTNPFVTTLNLPNTSSMSNFPIRRGRLSRAVASPYYGPYSERRPQMTNRSTDLQNANKELRTSFMAFCKGLFDDFKRLSETSQRRFKKEALSLLNELSDGAEFSQERRVIEESVNEERVDDVQVLREQRRVNEERVGDVQVSREQQRVNEARMNNVRRFRGHERARDASI